MLPLLEAYPCRELLLSLFVLRAPPELGRPKGAADRIALPVAWDDPAAKATVLKLVDELGFDGVDAGGLDESWRQQPGTPVYAKDFDAEGVAAW